MILSVAILLLGVPAYADETEPAPAQARELKVEKGILPRKDGKASDPAKIASREDLDKAIPDKDTAARIAKQVDFQKEFVLLFNWSGSGGDKLTMAQDKGVVFTLKRGLTRDLRRHAKVFAVPAGLKYTVGK